MGNKKTLARGGVNYGSLDLKPWLAEAWSNGLLGPPSRQLPKKIMEKECLKIDDLGAVPLILKCTVSKNVQTCQAVYWLSFSYPYLRGCVRRLRAVHTRGVKDPHPSTPFLSALHTDATLCPFLRQTRTTSFRHGWVSITSRKWQINWAWTGRRCGDGLRAGWGARA